MRLSKGDKFKITAGYGKRIFTVTEVKDADFYEYRCTDETGEVFFFSEKSFEVYAALKQFHIVRRANSNLAKAKEVFESAHIQTVEVGFEYEAGGARYYSAVTKDSGFHHLYTVRVWEDADGATFAKCNCAAIAECRHIAKVAVADAARMSRTIYYGSFTGYKAHRQQRLAA